MRMRKGGYGGGKQSAGPRGRGHAEGPRGRGHGRDRDEREQRSDRDGRAEARQSAPVRPAREAFAETATARGARPRRCRAAAARAAGRGARRRRRRQPRPSPCNFPPPCRPSPSRRTKTACASTASSRRAFPGLSFSHIQRIIRKGEVRVNGKRTEPKNRLEAGQAVRIPPLKLDAPQAARRRAAGAEGPRIPQIDHALRGRRRAGAQQADGACGAGRLRHHAPYRRHARRAARPGIGRPAPAPGASARQGHRRLPAGRQDALRRGGAGQDLPHRARRARSTGRWSRACRSRSRAASRPSSPRRSARRNSLHAHRPARREGREPRGHLLRGGRDGGAEAVLDFAQAGDRPHPSVARAHGACRPSDHRRSEIFQDRELGTARRHAEQAASAGAPHRGAASARRRRSTSPRRCRRTCSSRGTCSASTPPATTRSSRRRRSE